MFGTYTIVDGEYRFTMRDVVNKPFILERGSRIRFSGDPYDAEMRITAVYRTKAVPYDLWRGNTGSLTEFDIAKLKEAVEVDVLLYLSGSLESPNVRFDLQSRGGGAGSVGAFEAKLRELRSDTTELNKQAFGLLVFNQFWPSGLAEPGDNSGINVGTSGVNTVSEFVSNQLSRYFSDWLSRYDAEVGFNYSQYDGSDQTDPEKGYKYSELEVELKKKLGKITVNVGGSVELGAQAAGPQKANTLAGDFQVDYSITEDGRVRFIAFRRSDYDAFSTSSGGTIYKTGAGIFFKKDFDRWREFFEKQQ